MLELTGPVVVELELLPSEDSDSQEPALSVSQWEKVINKLNVYVQEYRVGGPDPVNHPEFFEILKILEKTGKFYHIFTDGLWENTDSALEGFVNCAHINTINFNLHGPDQETHRTVARKQKEEDFDRVLDNIRLCFSAGYSVNTRTVLNNCNIEKIEQITELSTEIGASHAIFVRYIGPEDTQMDVDPQKLKSVGSSIEDLKSLGYNVMLGNCIPYCMIPSQTAGCFEGVTIGSVDCHGNLKPSPHLDFSVGSLLDGEVPKLWRSPAMKKWRSDIPQPCRKCSKISVCAGGSRAYAKIRGLDQDPFIEEPIPKPQQLKILDVTLEEELCPLARYVMRKEDFGWILIQGNQVIPVRHRAEKILKALDGSSMTLGDIKKNFGSGALSFIYSLYVRDFIEFRTRVEEEAPI